MKQWLQVCVHFLARPAGLRPPPECAGANLCLLAATFPVLKACERGS